MNIDITQKRGHQSALSACPIPAALALSPRQYGMAPAARALTADMRLTAPVAAGFPGTGLSIADLRISPTVPTPFQQQFVQIRPGDTARRPPS